VETILDHSANARHRKLGAYYHGLHFMFSDERGKLFERPQELPTLLLAAGGDVPDDTVITTRGTNRLCKALRACRRAYEDRTSGSPLPRPDVLKAPFRKLSNE
jgi:hypothetical protein